jgi:DNA-binding IclR family transcriptional regulator
MTVVKPTSEEAVAKTLATAGELTVAEIAASTGLGRSTVAKALRALQLKGVVRRRRSGHEGRRRLPDQWSMAGPPEEQGAASERLRPGQLDALVLEYLDGRGDDVALGATPVAKALGRSAGAVGNCLARLAATGRVDQVTERPRRYCLGKSRATKRARRSRKGRS